VAAAGLLTVTWFSYVNMTIDIWTEHTSWQWTGAILQASMTTMLSDAGHYCNPLSKHLSSVQALGAGE